MKLIRSSLPLIISGAMLAGAIAVNHSGGQDAPPPEKPQRPASTEGNQDDGMAMYRGLINTPGCLGVESGQFRSGKQTIIAWFKDKKSVSDWYYSDTHMDFLDRAPGSEEHRPLRHIPDDVGQIMVIASLTPSDRPHFEGFDMPISQISIELFKPLPGGAYLGSRLSPDSFEVPHMHSLMPDKASKKAEAGD